MPPHYLVGKNAVPQPAIPPPLKATRELEPFSLTFLCKDDDDPDEEPTVFSQEGMSDALLFYLDKMQRNILSEIHCSEERLAAKLASTMMFRPVSRIASTGRVTPMSTNSEAFVGNNVSCDGARTPVTDGYLTECGTSDHRPSNGTDATYFESADGVLEQCQVRRGLCQVQSQGDIEDEDKNRLSQAQAVASVDPTSSSAFARARSYIAPVWAKRIMSENRMEYFFGMLILANSITIGVETQFAAHHISEGYPKEFFYVDLFFVMAFTAEIALRVANEGAHRFFCTSDQRAWAYVDTFIVAVSLLQMGLEIEMRIMGADPISLRMVTPLRALRIVRLLRIARILQFTRLMSFARALRTMVHQLLSTFNSLFWAVLLLMMIIYLFAILFTQAVTAHAHDMIEDISPEEMQSLLEHWSSIPVSMLSLYMSITGGINWTEVIQPLNEVGTVYTAIFIGYITLTQLAVLNILTGVFCQNAIEAASQDAELVTQHMLQQREMFVKRLETLFSEIDVDHSGTITLSEFQRHLTDARVQAYFEALELDSSNVWTLFKLMDEDQGNRIDMHEFVTGALKLRGAAKCVDLVNLKNDHNWMVKKMTRFMKRTDEALKEILRNSSSVAFLCPAPNIEAQA